MSRVWIFLCFLMAISGLGCAYHGQRAEVTSAGVQLCGKHKVPLQTIAGYEAGDSVISIWGAPAYRLAESRNPNLIPLWFSPKKNEVLTRPSTASYCPRCEAGLARINKLPHSAVDLQTRLGRVYVGP